MSFRRLLELFAGLGLLRLAALAVAGWWIPAPPAAALMPAATGALEQLAIQFHRVEHQRFLPVYAQLLTELDPRTRVRVVVADAEDEDLFRTHAESWFDGAGPELVFAHTGRPITSWMRDRLAVLDTDDDHVLLAPSAPIRGPEARVHDWMVPWTLGEHLGEHYRVKQARYRFDGGDLIADASRVYVASPLFDRNPDVPQGSVAAMLAEDLGRPVLALHDAPDHHIGMFLTPLGDGRVLLGDPALGERIVRDAGQRPDELVVGDQPVGHADPALLASFETVRTQLLAAGLEVVPMPALPTDQRYAWLSYNNVLLEERSGRLHVYLPVYGVAALDRAATRVWEDEGAVVHPIEVEGLFRLGGSVRCLTAPLARSSSLRAASSAPERIADRSPAP